MISNWGGYDMDISVVTMLLVCRLWALSFNYKDGDKNVNEKQLTKYQIEHKVDKLPSVLEMAGFTFFLGTGTIGCFFEYSDYIKFIR